MKKTVTIFITLSVLVSGILIFSSVCAALDLLPYIIPENENFRVYSRLKKPDGGTADELFSYRDGGWANGIRRWFFVKNDSGENWEEFGYDSNYIYRNRDSSWANTCQDGAAAYYKVTDQDRSAFARWIPRYMNVGQTWTSPWSHFVDAGYKHNNGCATDSCTSQYEGWVQNRHQLVAQHSTYTTIWGHTVNDVIELTDPYNTESDHFFYARGYGLVGFEGPAGNNAGRWRSGAYNINPDIGGASNWVGLCDEQLPPPTPPPPPPNPGTPPGDNLAFGASEWSASSVYNADFGGDKAYDGVIDAGSKWTSDGSSVESWLALDLGTNCDITGFIVRHAGAGGESAAYNTQAYRLESGNSLSGPWTTLATVNNSAQQNSSTTVLANSTTMRYVRLYITDAGIDNHVRIPEFEVYGSVGSTPPPPPPNPGTPPGNNLALDAPDWSASSVYSGDYGGDKAYDEVISAGSKWTSKGSSTASWLALDLGTNCDLTGFIVRHAGAAGESAAYNTQSYRLESGTSLSGPWTTLATVNNSAQQNSSTTILANNATTRYVRLYISDAGIDNHARIPEFEVYGSPGSTPPPPPPTGGPLTNGGFEDTAQGNGVGQGWSPFSTTGYGANYAVVSDQVQSGSYAQQVLSPQPSTTDQYAGVYQVFGTESGTRYTVRAWNQTQFSGGSAWDHIARLGIDLTGGTDFRGGSVAWYEFDSAKEIWHLLERNVTATGSSITIFLQSWRKWASGGDAYTWFDDVEVVADGQPPEPGNNPPSAAASANPTSGDAPLTVSFDATGSSDPDGDSLNYRWDFGDGTQGTGAAVSHTYQTRGIYPAILTVDDGRGGSDDVTATVAVSTSGVPLPSYCPSTLNFPAIRTALIQQGEDLGFVKIGFHVGPGGNQSGLGEWMRCLDAAGVPFFLKSADSGGQIWEAAQLKAASGVPHVLVYRKSVGDGWNPDVPDYNLSPYDSAVQHWQRHRDAFPPELEQYKHLIWLETINEIDKNRAEWLGEFAYHTAQMAMAEGFNWAAFGWSSGEPEREHWEGPWMRQFLELAGNNPDRVSVALHEYSYTRDNLDRFYPDLVGRFQMLFDVCDSYDIPRPNIVITEFGWEYQNVAGVGQAMDVDLPWAAGLYADFPEVLGAAIWHLGPGFGGIANQAQKLIAPLTAYTLQEYFVVPLESPGPPPPPPEPPVPSDTIGEVGMVTTNQPDSATWHVVSLENQYLNPVVIMQPPSFVGGQPVTIRLRNVTGSSFEFQMDEWDYLDGAHTTEKIGYMVLETGQYTLSGGARVEAGTIAAQHEFKHVSLTQSFGQVPVILSQSQTRNGGQPVVTRQRNASPSGFEVRLQEEDGNDGSHAVETIGYIAIETGKRVGDLPFSVQRTPDVVTHGWYPIDFEIISLDPVFLAGMQTQDGGDPAGLRHRYLDAISVEIKVEEEQSGDAETDHTTEVVGYVVFDAPGVLVVEP